MIGKTLIAALTTSFVVLSGCSVFAKQIDVAAAGAGKLVTYYCENVTTPEIRDELRAAVNAKAAPHSVAVTCANARPVLQSGP